MPSIIDDNEQRQQAIGHVLALAHDLKSQLEESWNTFCVAVQQVPFDEMALLYSLVRFQHCFEWFGQCVDTRYDAVVTKLEKNILSGQKKSFFDDNGEFLGITEATSSALDNIEAITVSEAQSLRLLPSLCAVKEVAPNSFLIDYLKRYSDQAQLFVSDDTIAKIYSLINAIMNMNIRGLSRYRHIFNDGIYVNFASYFQALGGFLGFVIDKGFTYGNIVDRDSNYHHSTLFLELLCENTNILTQVRNCVEEVEIKEGPKQGEWQKISTLSPSDISKILYETDLAAIGKEHLEKHEWLAAFFHLEVYNNEIKSFAELIQPIITPVYSKKKWQRLQSEVESLFSKRFNSPVHRLLECYTLITQSGYDRRKLPQPFVSLLQVIEGGNPALVKKFMGDTTQAWYTQVTREFGEKRFDDKLTEQHTQACTSSWDETACIDTIFCYIRNLCRYVIKHPRSTFKHDRHYVIGKLLKKANEILLQRDTHPVDRLVELYDYAMNKSIGKGELHEFTQQLAPHIFGQQVAGVYNRYPRAYKRSPEYRSIVREHYIKCKDSNELLKQKRDTQVYVAVAELVQNAEERIKIWRKLINAIKNVFSHPLKSVAKRGFFSSWYDVNAIGSGTAGAASNTGSGYRAESEEDKLQIDSRVRNDEEDNFDFFNPYPSC